jgi:hypothetical protein
MAIDSTAIQLWRHIKVCLPFRPTILEIGQANWFGDVELDEVEELRDVPNLDKMDYFEIAKVYYSRILEYSVLDSIDGGGVDNNVFRHDLNEPLPSSTLKPEYDIIINTGTLEHVFDQRQVFETIHNRTKLGGLMVHAFPISGCKDHGFYNYHPNMLYNLAYINNYKTLVVFHSERGEDQVLHLAWKKTKDETFKIPYQRDCVGIMGGKFHPIERDTTKLWPIEVEV